MLGVLGNSRFDLLVKMGIRNSVHDIPITEICIILPKKFVSFCYTLVICLVLLPKEIFIQTKIQSGEKEKSTDP